jgi:hypothetical protein
MRAGRPRLGDGALVLAGLLPPVVVTSIVLLWRLLQRAIVAHPTRLLRGLQVVCILDVLISSAYWLHFRHTRVEVYAVQATAMFRSTFLTPQSFHNERDLTGRNGGSLR